MTRSLRRAAAMSIGAGLLAVLGMGGTAYAGSTGTVSLTVPGCVGKLHLDGGGSSNWASATLQSTGPKYDVQWAGECLVNGGSVDHGDAE